MKMLLSSGFYHGIATHDPRMIAATIRHAAAKQISKDDFEFQMLYGVRTDLSDASSRTAIASASTSLSAKTGSLISCAASPSAPPTWASSSAISSADKIAQRLQFLADSDAVA